MQSTKIFIKIDILRNYNGNNKENIQHTQKEMRKKSKLIMAKRKATREERYKTARHSTND